MPATLPKSERLKGEVAVSRLFRCGASASAPGIRCKYLPREDEGPSRIVVSVPKRLFKRAVKRNLLKRRIRESYRRQKSLLSRPMDILFVYNTTEVLSYEDVFAGMTALLKAVDDASNA